MSMPSAIQRIAIVGTGTIGASWATHFLARGYDVVATDPASGAEAALRGYVQNSWPVAARLGLAADASPDRLTFTSDLSAALADADFVQENAPERPDLKIDLLARIDAATPPDTIIASSSSGITMSVMQSKCQAPQRTLIGHPFNPPHLIPLVEVVGGERTAPGFLDAAMEFYAAIGKKPILLNKELPGHVANRLQSALYREIVHLVEQGVLSVADADDAVSWGPGLRWGVMGPSLLWHLGGGRGGIEHFMATLMPRMTQQWDELGEPTFTPALEKQIVAGVIDEAHGRTIDDLAAQRDDMLLDLIATRTSGVGRHRDSPQLTTELTHQHVGEPGGTGPR